MERRAEGVIDWERWRRSQRDSTTCVLRYLGRRYYILCGVGGRIYGSARCCGETSSDEIRLG